MPSEDLEIKSVGALDRQVLKGLCTKTLSELGAGILPEGRKGTPIDFLIGRFHTEHSFSATVAFLGEVINDLW